MFVLKQTSLELDIAECDVHCRHHHGDKHTRKSELKEHAEAHRMPVRGTNTGRDQVGSRSHERTVASEASAERQGPGQRDHVEIELGVGSEHLDHRNHGRGERDVIQNGRSETRHPQNHHVSQERLPLHGGLDDKRGHGLADGTDYTDLVDTLDHDEQTREENESFPFKKLKGRVQVFRRAEEEAGEGSGNGEECRVDVVEGVEEEENDHRDQNRSALEEKRLVLDLVFLTERQIDLEVGLVEVLAIHPPENGAVFLARLFADFNAVHDGAGRSEPGGDGGAAEPYIQHPLALKRHVLEAVENEGVRRIVTDFAESGKWIGAICAAPTILGDLGLLKGKRISCYPSVENDIQGAVIMKTPVTVDGKFVTSRGVGTAIDFALELITVLAGKEKAVAIAESVEYR